MSIGHLEIAIRTLLINPMYRNYNRTMFIDYVYLQGSDNIYILQKSQTEAKTGV